MASSLCHPDTLQLSIIDAAAVPPSGNYCQRKYRPDGPKTVFPLPVSSSFLKIISP